MKKRIITIVTIAILFILVSAVLFNSLKEKESNLTKVKVAEVAHSIFYAPQYAAISNGYFEDYGIEIDLTLVPGVVRSITHFINNLFYLSFLIFVYFHLLIYRSFHL